MYSEIKGQIKPFDIILFKGGEVVSSAIRFIEQVTLGVENRSDTWSHVGLVVTRELFDDKRLEEGKLYLLESTLSGKLNDNIKNIDGKAFFGVQIRELDKLAKKYSKYDKKGKKRKTAIGWARLLNNPFRDDSPNGLILREKIKIAFTKIYPKRWENIMYDINLLSLGAAAFPILKPLKWVVMKFDFLNTDKWMYCSELCIDVLQVFKFYPPNIDGSLVMPNEMIGYSNDSIGVPVIFDDVIEIKNFL